MLFTEGNMSRIDIKGTLPSPVCVNDICTITMSLGELVYTDGGGSVASRLTDFNFRIIQSSSNTNWIANFGLYNKTHDVVAGDETGLGHVYIRFRDALGNYLSDTVDIRFDRTGCLYQGPKTPAGLLSDIIKSGAVTYEISQQTLTADINDC
jgi:hypothetical protein